MSVVLLMNNKRKRLDGVERQVIVGGEPEERTMMKLLLPKSLNLPGYS